MQRPEVESVATVLRPVIASLGIVLFASACGNDGVGPAPQTDRQAASFSGPYERRLLPGIGHNLPQEAPAATVNALQDLMKGAAP